MLIPVIDFKSSPARWLVEPLPDEPKLMVPGLALASAISSPTLFTPSEGCTASTIGTVAISATGAKAVAASNFSDL